MELSRCWRENEVKYAKLAWLSRKNNAKAYGSMLVYVAIGSDAACHSEKHVQQCLLVGVIVANLAKEDERRTRQHKACCRVPSRPMLISYISY